jgi:SAM-dependent methyltransferase
MTGFSADWLALREPVDLRARAPALSEILRDRLAHRRSVSVVDLGCGTGANLRATAPLLGRRQRWRLVDHDQALLDAAAARLSNWADRVESIGDSLTFHKDDKRIEVRFHRADLRDEVERGDLAGVDLVTASALFDLVSAELIQSLALALARAGVLFHTVLTYDGEQRWAPAHGSDAGVIAAFNAHQQRDKGLGPAAGSAAHRHLVDAFAATSARLHIAASPWRLGPTDGRLIRELFLGIAEAARETGLVASEAIAAWLAAPRQSCEIGHQDLLVVPD